MWVKKLLLLLSLAAFVVSATEIDKKRVALTSLNRTNVTKLEATVTELSIRDAFVTSGEYDVLDRENMSKLLSERKIGINAIQNQDSVAMVGMLLNVQYIVVGKLMRFENAYLLEVNLVDIGTSAIVASATGKCNSARALLKLGSIVAGRVVNPSSITEIEESKKEVVMAIDTPIVKKEEPVTVVIAKYTMELNAVETLFESCGLSDVDYQRFFLSNDSLFDWAEKYRREPAIAAVIGAVTSTSGFLVTQDYGTAMLVTLVKAFGIIGMVTNYEKGGTIFWGSVALYSGATAGDMVGSAIMASVKNEKLKKLIDGIPSLEMNSVDKSIKISVNKKF